jgi:hypothetical protein
MKSQDKYIERNDLKGATHLEVSVYYSKGGVSYFVGGTMPRGYYIAIKPVTKNDYMVRYELFSGRKQLLFETARYSEKQFARAIEMANDVESDLIAAVIAENQSVQKAA